MTHPSIIRARQVLNRLASVESDRQQDARRVGRRYFDTAHDTGMSESELARFKAWNGAQAASSQSAPTPRMSERDSQPWNEWAMSLIRNAIGRYDQALCRDIGIALDSEISGLRTEIAALRERVNVLEGQKVTTLAPKGRSRAA